MVVRSLALFAHIVGMLVLFTGLALEWLSLESLHRSIIPLRDSPWVKVLAALPRYIAGAVGLIVVSGIYLAMRVGVFDQGWVRVSFGSMVVMGILGGPVIRSQMRAILRTGGDGGPSTVGREPLHPLLRASLRARVAVGLAIVYLMIGKPDFGESLLVVGAALALGAATSVPQWRVQPSAYKGSI
jgi:uncharacterized membrane protein